MKTFIRAFEYEQGKLVADLYLETGQSYPALGIRSVNPETIVIDDSINSVNLASGSKDTTILKQVPLPHQGEVHDWLLPCGRHVVVLQRSSPAFK